MEKINKQQLAEELSNQVSGVSRAQAKRLLDVLTEIITEQLCLGEIVVLSGFGAFSARKRKGRIGVNPRNPKEQIEMPAVTVAKFKAGKNLKDALKASDSAHLLLEKNSEISPEDAQESPESTETHEVRTRRAP